MKSSLFSSYFKWWHYRWSVPKYDIKILHTADDENKFLKHLSPGGVRIVRESPHGIPHIFGKTKYDVFFGQGFAQAQERLAQLETLRRVSHGTMSELDKNFLFIDRMVLTIGINDNEFLDQLEKELDPDSIKFTESFCNGINYFLKSKYYRKPVHLYETKNPDVHLFTVRDILILMLFFCWQMNMGGFLIKIINATLQSKLDPSDLESFQIGSSRENQPVHHFYETMDWKELSKYLDLDKPGGSNCVSVSPQFTKSGNSMLFSDPHLGVLNPSFIFQSRLKCDEFDATGFSAAGLMGVLIGHNNHISIGVTLSFCDLYELFFEEVHPKDDTKYLHHIETDEGGKEKKIWKKFKIKEYKNFKVNGYKDTIISVRKTDRGPIISDCWDNIKIRNFEKGLIKKGWFSGSSSSSGGKKEDRYKKEFEDCPTFGIKGKGKEFVGKKYVLSFKSVFTENLENSNIMSLYDMMKCKNFQDLKSLLEKMKRINMNFSCADSEGNIGYYMSGAIPRRSREAQALNNMPLPGWIPEKYDWTRGYYDVKENPHCFNPKTGFIVSCNQEMVSQSDYYKNKDHIKEEDRMFFGRVYMPSSRARQMTSRILKKIKEIEEQKNDVEENEGESDNEEKEKKEKKNNKIDLEYGKFLQRDCHFHEDNLFMLNLCKDFVSKRIEIEIKRRNWQNLEGGGKLANDKYLQKTLKINPGMIYGVAQEICDWDFNFLKDSVGCTIYTLMEGELLHSILLDGGGLGDPSKKNFFSEPLQPGDTTSSKELYGDQKATIFAQALNGHGINREYWALSDYWEKVQNIVELLLDKKKLQNPKTLGYHACLLKVDQEEAEEEEEEIEGEEEGNDKKKKKKKSDDVDLHFLLWKVFTRIIMRLRNMDPSAKLPMNKWEDEIKKNYQWGRYHTTTYKHSLKDFTSDFNIGPFPMEGGTKTPNAQVVSNDMEDLAVECAPCLRFVADMGKPKAKAEGICPPGISENPCSPHYGDTAKDFVEFKYHSLDQPELKDFVQKRKEHEGIIVIKKRFLKKKKKKKGRGKQG